MDCKRHFGTALGAAPTGEFLTEQELDLLMSGQDYLSRVRFALHHLTVGTRTACCSSISRRSLDDGVEDEGKLAVEQFMQAYFRNVQAVSHVSALLIDIYQKTLLQAEASSSTVIDEDFELIDDRISARHAAVLRRTPPIYSGCLSLSGETDESKESTQTTRLCEHRPTSLMRPFATTPSIGVFSEMCCRHPSP